MVCLSASGIFNCYLCDITLKSYAQAKKFTIFVQSRGISFQLTIVPTCLWPVEVARMPLAPPSAACPGGLGIGTTMLPPSVFIGLAESAVAAKLGRRTPKAGFVLDGQPSHGKLC